MNTTSEILENYNGCGCSGGGSSECDFSIAMVTIRQTSFPDFDPIGATTTVPVLYNDTFAPIRDINIPITVGIPLYNGTVTYEYGFINAIAYDGVHDISGDISFDENTGQFTISGNCEVGVGSEK